jgi:hypothetical protein
MIVKKATKKYFWWRKSDKGNENRFVASLEGGLCSIREICVLSPELNQSSRW